MPDQCFLPLGIFLENPLFKAIIPLNNTFYVIFLHLNGEVKVKNSILIERRK